MIGSITKWKPDTKRPRGRPRQRWVDRVKEDLKLLNVRNAGEWKQYVVAAMGRMGPVKAQKEEEDGNNYVVCYNLK